MNSAKNRKDKKKDILPVGGKSMLKMLWLVVLCRECSLVECVLGRVCLRCGLDIHEGNRRWYTPGDRRDSTADRSRTNACTADLASLACRTTWTSVHGAFFAPWQQFDALHASIPAKQFIFLIIHVFQSNIVTSLQIFTAKLWWSFNRVWYKNFPPSRETNVFFHLLPIFSLFTYKLHEKQRFSGSQRDSWEMHHRKKYKQDCFNVKVRHGANPSTFVLFSWKISFPKKFAQTQFFDSTSTQLDVRKIL